MVALLLGLTNDHIKESIYHVNKLKDGPLTHVSYTETGMTYRINARNTVQTSLDTARPTTPPILHNYSINLQMNEKIQRRARHH